MAQNRGGWAKKHTEPCRNRFMKLFGSAAKATAAAQAVNRLVRASAELDEDVERRKRPRWCHRKRKLEEDAKQQEEDAKRQKQEEDERKLAAKTCVDDPKPKLDFVVTELRLMDEQQKKVSIGQVDKGGLSHSG